MIPSISFLRRVSGTMWEAGLEHALGGSGLLYVLGIHGRVNDWDLTTEANFDKVADALSAAEIPYVRRDGEFPFASAFRLVITVEEGQLDLIGRFSIQTRGRVCRVPTVPRFRWNGIPVGSLEAWAVAYALMERWNKADSLFQYVTKMGADRRMVDFLLQEPLPAEVKRRIREWDFS